ncbi:MAG: hypothetical protein AAGD14_11175 [Planctomycetota bacterium]
MRFAALFLSALAACASTARTLDPDAPLPRDRMVVTGEMRGASELVLHNAAGGSVRVPVSDGRFLASIPPGVYEFEGRTLHGIPGDVLYIGSIAPVSGRWTVQNEFRAYQLEHRDRAIASQVQPRVLAVERELSPGGHFNRTSNGSPYGASFYGGGASRRSSETPGAYQARTGSPARSLPGSGRAGQGLGFRGR